jgi:hypothetical protein
MPWSTTRPPGTQAIYRTPEHRKARAALIKAYRPGDPCCLCGHAMWPPTSQLHADHDPADPRRYRGLAHGTTPCQDCGVKCNVSDGSRRGNQRSRGITRRWEF